MKYTKLVSLITFVFAVLLSAVKADTLVGSTYLSATANVTDLRSPVTSKSLNSGNLAVNAALFNHVDLGGSIEVQRLADNKVDVSNLKGEVTTTVYTTVLGFKPFVRGGLGWNFNRTGVKKFQAADYRVGIGAEVSPFKNLSVGAEAYITAVQKAVTGGSQRVYRPYATLWLNDYVGVTGAYTYNQTANSAGYSVGGVLKF